MIAGYHILSSCLFLVSLPFLWILYLVSEKRRASLFQRLGMYTGLERKKAGTFRIWVHALSVGEVRSALPFVRSLKERKPFAQIIFTASTKTGFETAQTLLGQDALVSQIGYFPMDFWFSVLRVSSLIDPDLVCLVETDLWPGFLSHMKQRRVPVVLLNARISQRSLKGYLALGRFSALFFSSFSHVMAQTPLDGQGFEKIGMEKSCVSVVGNIKFDQSPESMCASRRESLKARLGIQDQDQIWIAGSTHGGEEKLLLDAYAAVKKKIPALKLILAPRDPKRSEKLASQFRSFSYPPVLLSKIGTGIESPDLVFIDRLGILGTLYAICDLAFIGGSLVPQGGHNPLEPAMYGKPILFGPHMTDFVQVADLLKEKKGACQVETQEEIQSKMEEILANKGVATQMGEASFRVFSTHAGAVARTLDKMEELGLV